MFNLGRLLGRVLRPIAAGLFFLAVVGGIVMVALALNQPDRSTPTAPGQRVSNVRTPEGVREPGPAPFPGPAVVGDEPQPPYTYGDDLRLDGLWDECEAGSGRACDRLFGEAPLASEYERFGVSCGERPQVLHCQAEMDGDPAESFIIEIPIPTMSPDDDAVDGDDSGSGIQGATR